MYEINSSGKTWLEIQCIDERDRNILYTKAEAIEEYIKYVIPDSKKLDNYDKARFGIYRYVKILEICMK